MKEIVKKLLHSGFPVPRFLRPVGRLKYHVGVAVAEGLRALYAWFLVKPIMKCIAEGGDGLRIERIPYIRGKGRINIGSNVYISGQIGVGFSSHAATLPELHIGHNTFIGSGCSFNLAKEIRIGNDCLIGADVRIQDNDGHPLDPVKRRAREPVGAEDIKSVVIEDNVWIGASVTILKGVHIGANSVIGAGAVVTTDTVPPNSVFGGNPGRVVKSL